MPDEVFAHPRLAAIYDAFDGVRDDLTHYVAIAKELGAGRALDVGCGTGCLALRLAAEGIEVCGVDPAAASLAVARGKPGAGGVVWVEGVVEEVEARGFDVALMTGNVAQVFLDEDGWRGTLAAIRARLRPSGSLVFEVRDPARRAWEGWDRASTYQRLEVPGVGPVEGWCELLDVRGRRVSFRWTYRFLASGETLRSDSTLVFRSAAEVHDALRSVGFRVVEVRDAPDRPGCEFVFVAVADS